MQKRGIDGKVVIFQNKTLADCDCQQMEKLYKNVGLIFCAALGPQLVIVSFQLIYTCNYNDF